MAPPNGNLNRARNGQYLRRLNVGELPAELRAVKREGRRYRRELEAETLRQCGEITTTAAHAIDTAAAATIHAGVCRWLLRQRLDKMTTADILNCSREITKAKQARDAAVKSLGLDKPADVMLTLYGPDPDYVAPALPGFEPAEQPADVAPPDAPDDGTGAAQDAPSTDEPSEREPTGDAGAEGQVSR